MQLKDMIELIELYIDDVVQAKDAVRLLNAGQNKMATEVRANFPQLTLTSDLSGTFIFPEKFHEIPVLYAAGMMKAVDSSLPEKQDYLGQFVAGVKDFAENYSPAPQYRDESNTQQFTATVAQTDFTITKESYSQSYGNLRVYVNGLPSVSFTTFGDTSFRLKDPLVAGDFVTAVWDERYDYSIQPVNYPGW